MAFIQTDNKLSASFFENLATAFRNMIERYKQYRLYAKTVSELQALSGRELSDLGLSRSMIESVSYSAVYEINNNRKTLP